MRATRENKGVSHYIPIGFAFFSLCGTMFPFFFCRRRGSSICIGSTRANRHASISWNRVCQIIINARPQLGAADHVSDIGRWLFNHAFREPRIDTWAHLDTTMKIGRAKNQETWDRGPPFSRDRSRKKPLQQIGRTAFIAIISV